ncbi:hypothetical protein H2200_001966 [Cladophialophora chaetospira]|uniref:Uncharacterized protein n=1 Tax=Cladophialophora chaetospira TaxID=386627 RepID=A0AA38XLW5_9EURO|nr:hypothetical protein H2200_001966 [Cladophialophora chaetospira]
MTKLDDLPAELLLNLPLSRPDTVSMIKACRRFSDVLKPRLYRYLVLNCYYQQAPDFFGGECITRRDALSWLRSSLLNQRDNLPGVQRFAIVSAPNGDLAKNLNPIAHLIAPSLRHLDVDINDNHFCGLLDHHPWPRLEVIAASIDEYSYKLHERLVRLVCQSSIVRSLRFERYSYYPRQAYNPYYPLWRAYRADSGRELNLNGLKPKVKLLLELIKCYQPLEALVLIRGTRRWSYGVMRSADDRGSEFKMQHFHNILELARESLRKLAIVRKFPYVCDLDGTLLPSLRTFNQLRNLRIEVILLLGGLSQPVLQSAILTDTVYEARHVADFASLLPESLERLDLHVDPWQLQEHQCLASSILRTLLEEKERLQRLSLVTIEETCCTEHIPKNRGESTVTPWMIRSMQDACAAKGMSLTYIKRGWPFGFDAARIKAPFHTKIYEPGAEPRELQYSVEQHHIFLGHQEHEMTG